ncbi:translational GTPase TypA [Fastidiosipila sanguinis]|uniref:Large ribosomal subunit assembly factor BipA n=1 Tax=Fastidiosipila sanguinis TaxID=236753 RepID=A0A2S0KNR2_9FIRM|nr:translational GTPase TypA [Fastidiosipila sanguinis]AVM42675.1 translational GTPase TypA [Fastidiosipila sanguinis]
MSKTIEKIRNIAIIAHVDHGKTTLVDSMLKQSGTFRSNENVVDRVMDSDALEKERGITIMAKNTAIHYKDYRINIVDTPGHADFGGEVERVLKMVDGVILLVDSFDGPMPQTRFVLRKALGLGLKACVVVNKVDRPDARPEEVLDEVLDLFIELGADDDQLDFPHVFASGKNGYAVNSLDEVAEASQNGGDLEALFSMIIEQIPAPEGDTEAPLQLLISNIDFDPYVGRIGIGEVHRGTIKSGQNVAISRKGDEGSASGKVVKLMRFEGLAKAEIESASVGEIVAVAGITDVEIGETLTAPDVIEPFDFIEIDEPTIAMTFSVNDSPLAGTEGKYLTSRHIKGRLIREMERNVSMQLEETDSTEAFVVKGRGELSLSILAENMRREGYEIQLSKPQVVLKEDENGKKLEPVEEVFIEVPDENLGVVIEKMANRKAVMQGMKAGNAGYTRITFHIPSRGLIGYRNEFLTDTKGNGVMSTEVIDYQPWAGDIKTRSMGVLVATQSGESIVYGLHGAQSRGDLFIGPNEKVYEGMIVGRTNKSGEVDVNVCKKKNLTNVRASGSDDALTLTPPSRLSLEQCLEFVDDDELIEITPENIRLRKKILNTEQRRKALSKSK